MAMGPSEAGPPVVALSHDNLAVSLAPRLGQLARPVVEGRANCLINLVSTMWCGRSFDIQVRVAHGSFGVEPLEDTVPTRLEGRRLTTFPLGPEVAVILDDRLSDFQDDTRPDQRGARRQIMPGAVTSWDLRVTPLRPGPCRLVLRPLVYETGAEEPVAREPILDRAIDVHRNALHAAAGFVVANRVILLKWLLVWAVIPVAIWAIYRLGYAAPLERWITTWWPF